MLSIHLFIYFLFLQTQKSLATFERRQMRLTTTMCVSCLFTTVLYVIPMCARYFHVLEVKKRLTELIPVYSLISCNLNPLTIIATIYVMQEDIREAVFSSFPQCLQLWLLKYAPILGSSTLKTIKTCTTPIMGVNGIRL